MKEGKLLLHICCAPDATVPCLGLLSEGYGTVGFFYGSNIHPEKEYIMRKESVEILSRAVPIDVFILPYDPEPWLEATKDFADHPEGGERCVVCFKLQLEAAAVYAEKHGFKYLSTTLTISPHKNPELINRIGAEAAERHRLLWIDKIWRKNNGFKRSIDESRILNLYRQNYCGCIYSENG